MKRLVDHVATRSGTDRVFVDDRLELKGGSLIEVVERTRAEHSVFRGSSVGVCFSRGYETALALVALDGFAEQLLIVPPTSKPARVREFIDRTDTEFILGNRENLRTGGLRQYDIRNLCGLNGGLTQKEDDGNAGDRGTVCDTEWILATSGTTGTPKLVAHDLSSLLRTVKTDTKVGHTLRWGLLYDLCRFAGIQVFLQSLVGGSTLIFADHVESIDEQVNLLLSGNCNALSGTPTMWRRLLMSDQFENLSLRIATLGGEIADGQILKALQRTFPEAKISHIYASTEAGVGFSVSDGQPGFPATFLENPPEETEIKVSDEGLLHLRPPQPEQERYVEEGLTLTDGEGWINTGDVVERSGDRFLFQGRESGVINVGGNKVHPEKVENVIQEVEGVAQVVVRAKKSAITGNLVEALVKPSGNVEGEQELRSAVRERCNADLNNYEVPAVCKVVSSLEMNAAGKLVR
ncbi:ANL family adenylate-forming protein [Salinibacter pepae]|uniref:ANL family adenylate-forming protein n=1 Tax=Salinibacter pepae TaxID=3040382 RepID=UPI0021E774BB|nr:class I adenylate-forming enzyme family protein [Salinibacter pepae]